MKRLRPHGKIKISRTQPKANIPALIRRELDVKENDSIPYILDANTVLLFNPKIPAEKVVEGLRALEAHLLARVEETCGNGAEQTSERNVEAATRAD